jgi:MFS family permease
MNDFKKYRWILFWTIGTLYFLVHLYRVSPTVIARDLALSFNADAVVLGIISSSYFYLYALVQPAVGYLSDTAGPRKVLSVSFFIASVGAVLFALAPDATMATVGRTLIGAGTGGVFIPALKIFANWYRIDEFAILTGFMLTIGGCGALAAAAPLTYLVMWLGWRGAFLGVGLFSFALAAFCWVILRDKPKDKGWPAVQTIGLSPAAPEGSIGLTKRMRLILGNFDFWMLAAFTFLTGGVVITFQGLWAVPYLTDVFGLNRIEAGWALLLIPLGFAVGAPSLGMLARRLDLDHKKLLVGTMIAGTLGWAVMLFLHDRAHLALVIILFFLLGFAGGGTTPFLFTLTRPLFPAELMGTAAGVMNMATFFGTALFQPFAGYLLQRHPMVQPGTYAFDAYWDLLVFFMISFAVAALVTLPLLRRK